MKKAILLIYSILEISCRHSSTKNDGLREYEILNDISISIPSEYQPVDSGIFNSDNLNDKRTFYSFTVMDKNKFINISKKKAELENQILDSAIKIKIRLLDQIISKLEVISQTIVEIDNTKYGFIEYRDRGSLLQKHNYLVFTTKDKIDYEFNYNLTVQTLEDKNENILSSIYSIKIK